MKTKTELKKCFNCGTEFDSESANVCQKCERDIDEILNGPEYARLNAIYKGFYFEPGRQYVYDSWSFTPLVAPQYEIDRKVQGNRTHIVTMPIMKTDVVIFSRRGGMHELFFLVNGIERRFEITFLNHLVPVE